MLNAIIKHIVLLFSFRHSGQGLPDHGPLPYIFVAMAAMATTFREYVQSADFFRAAATAMLVVLMITLVARTRPKLVSPLALIASGGDVIAIFAWLVDLPALATATTVWQFVAMAVFIVKQQAADIRKK